MDQRNHRMLRLSTRDANERRVKESLELKDKKRALEQEEIEKRRRKSDEDIEKLFRKGIKYVHLS